MMLQQTPLVRFQKAFSVLFVILFFGTGVEASQRTGWQLDTSNQSAPMARVNIFALRGNTHSFALVFETNRKCEPMFSMFTFHSPGSLGSTRSIETIGPGNFYVAADGIRHTWHAAVAQYSNGEEVAMGVTQELWKSLLSGAGSISFIRPSGSYDVPTTGLQRAASMGLDRCLRRIAE